MIFTVKEPVFTTCLHVFVKEDLKKVKRHTRKHYKWGKDDFPVGSDTSDGKCIYDNGYLYGYLWLPEGIKTPYAVGILAHELGHFLVHCFDVIGEPVIKNREEAFLYMLKFYMEKILEKA